MSQVVSCRWEVFHNLKHYFEMYWRGFEWKGYEELIGNDCDGFCCSPWQGSCREWKKLQIDSSSPLASCPTIPFPSHKLINIHSAIFIPVYTHLVPFFPILFDMLEPFFVKITPCHIIGMLFYISPISIISSRFNLKPMAPLYDPTASFLTSPF